MLYKKGPEIVVENRISKKDYEKLVEKQHQQISSYLQGIKEERTLED